MKYEIRAGNVLKAVEGLKGISHETRLTILCALVDTPKTVNELVEITGALQSSVSQHLAKMQHANWVTFTRKGPKKYYALANPGTSKLLKALYEIYCQ